MSCFVVCKDKVKIISGPFVYFPANSEAKSHEEKKTNLDGEIQTSQSESTPSNSSSFGVD